MSTVAAAPYIRSMAAHIVQHAGFRVAIIPVLKDNYAYLIIDESGAAAAIDPTEPEKVLDVAKKAGCTVEMILTTHKHWDHAGGNAQMAKLVPGLTVVGSAVDDVEACTQTVAHDEVLTLGSLPIRCLLTPGHTAGSLSFHTEGAEQGEEGAVFTGDTLFVGGCGRLFEGTAEDMAPSMLDVLGSLPGATKVYCGHEYTVSNLTFALSVETENERLAQMLAWANEQILSKGLTVPSSIEQEKAINPFMRVGSSAQIISACGCDGPVDVFRWMREKKNAF